MSQNLLSAAVGIGALRVNNVHMHIFSTGRYNHSTWKVENNRCHMISSLPGEALRILVDMARLAEIQRILGECLLI